MNLSHKSCPPQTCFGTAGLAGGRLNGAIIPLPCGRARLGVSLIVFLSDRNCYDDYDVTRRGSSIRRRRVFAQARVAQGGDRDRVKFSQHEFISAFHGPTIKRRKSHTHIRQMAFHSLITLHFYGNDILRLLLRSTQTSGGSLIVGALVEDKSHIKLAV